MPEHAVILLAEDEEADAFFISRAVSRSGIPNDLYVLRDGEEVIAYLKGEGKYGHRAEFPVPNLLLLDLDMPRKDGFAVLEWVRNQRELKQLRVLVLTSSGRVQDMARAYKLGADSFLVKPSDFSNLLQLTGSIRDFWSSTSTRHMDTRFPAEPGGGPTSREGAPDVPPRV